ncbi:flagellar motor protein MotD [Fulvimonas sp. R45]|uniref:flagellar motor protein MotD n=1 Tax=Fulvimonas sp. R45 TaxID=3045937 RepID=UPI00265EB770|nr:flagellar motor protein MotD [Fulvimonas sp. R45]MDO1528375.1 flagellar motor protein MotD [Fulvimonas sp. R45]
MRRRHREEKLNHEAWAIPYADLLTLLLAFFVVMYAVSVVNEGKYRVMSESIIEAFNGTARHVAPAQGNTAMPVAPVPARHAPAPSRATVMPRLALPLPTRNVMASAMQQGALNDPVGEQRNLERIRDQVRQALQPLIDRRLVTVRPSKDWLEIEIRTDILFPSGVAQLSAQAGQVLRKLAGILAPFPNPLRVEGYTDDVPINTAVYPSNWELSAARAASVARLFAEHGVDPDRLGIVGWSEYRPAAGNDTAEGRNRNRRVLVVVLGNRHVPSRFGTDANGLGRLVEATPAPAASSSPAPAAVPAEAPAGNAATVVVTASRMPGGKPRGGRG